MTVREPKIVMTLMVRDEADIIAAMIEHHLAQGVDLIIATDNGSLDGTREILADYAATGRLELHDYLAHDKNQTAVVSGMASRAATEHGATWVINADADEFFLPRDPGLTLRAALRRIPTSLGSFSVPVVNMSGVPARSGPSLARLTLRDVRDESSLMATVALHAHPTADIIHVGRAGVVVGQGNHGVDIPSLGKPEPAYALEVLHYPWRSYEQYGTKIANTGRSYDANPTLNPSPRHHGMRDYRFWKAGVLEPLYLVRHPDLPEDDGFVEDLRVHQGLQSLLESGDAVMPQHLAAAMGGDVVGYAPDERIAAATVARIVIPLEIEHIEASTMWRDLYRAEAARHRAASRERDTAVGELARVRSLPVMRARSLLGRVVRAPKAIVRRLRESI
ncbi:glycosyltransferase family 2 protein [Microbacterium sp. CFBP9034]|uniref:glycosyltransferase family 2 protein n=1 Tax=Microbacterium sp. CFBP9034 TaxID=3096540 RepID=UPI002A6A2102|nr:glycosyltransferase family 2 protein [Microbacterium sp. CFBP9034]MDY0909008.1 glycosyltransferase family 2 protein [Microbacterium sp. CFBP9034]